jgi:hypothetical protein
MLRPLTSVSIPHHHASGFDQARDPKRNPEEEADKGRDAGRDDSSTGRAGHSKLMRDRSEILELTFACRNSVTNRSGPRRKLCEGFMTGRKTDENYDSTRGPAFSRRAAPE